MLRDARPGSSQTPRTGTSLVSACQASRCRIHRPPARHTAPRETAQPGCPRPPTRPRRRRASEARRPGGSERQTIMVRRGIAAGAGLLVLILLIFGIKAASTRRKDRAFRDYAADVRAIVEESNGLSDKPVRARCPSRGSADALDIQNEINAQATDAEQLVERAKGTDHPDELNGAQRWIVTALEFRRDALKRIARRSRRRLATSGPPAGDRVDRRTDAGLPGKRRDLFAARAARAAAAVSQAQHRRAVPAQPIPSGPRLARSRRPSTTRLEQDRQHAARRRPRACTAPGSRA